MRVVIAGCGRVGAELASRFLAGGWDVAVVDRDPASFSKLANDRVEAHRGVVFDRTTLLAAGIERADAFVAVTSGDNSNVVSALVAKRAFRVPTVIARIYEPRRAEIYRRFGISAVSSVAWATNEVLSLVGHAGVRHGESFGDGEVRMVEVLVPPRLAGHQLRELEVPNEIRVVSLVRTGRSRVPSLEETMEEHDLLHVAVATAAMERLERMLTP